MAPMRFFLTLDCDARKFESGLKVAIGAVFRDAAHDLVSFVRRGGDFAAIQVDRQSFVTLVG